MDKLPFSLYDTLGYVAPGFVLLLTANVVFGLPAIIGQDLAVWDGAAVVLAAYVVGHVAATPSQALLEDVVVGRILGRPHERLLCRAEGWRAKLALLFRRYFTPLPEERCDEIKARARREGKGALIDRLECKRGGVLHADDQGLFLHVRYHPDSISDARLESKLESFVAAYGFARNMAFAALVAALALFARACRVGGLIPVGPSHQVSSAGLATVAAALAFGLFHRYLKTHRQYTYELLNAYASYGGAMDTAGEPDRAEKPEKPQKPEKARK